MTEVAAEPRRHPITAWVLAGIDIAFVAAVGFICWTLVWCNGPFERIGWPFLGFVAGPPLLLAGAIYFGISAARRRKVTVPVVTITAMVGLSVLLISTGVLQKVRWAQARPLVIAVADHPPARGETQHRRFGTYTASVHTNSTGTVLIKFDGSWDGLLYVPPGLPEPDRTKLVIGREVMPRWWYYDTD